MPTKPRFKACVLAVLVAAMPFFTEAAGLSRLNVLSGLGQPFKGEIDLVAVQPNEVETLKISLGSVEAYSAAQLSYPATTLGLRLALEKRANGQYFVQISSKGAIDEPVFNLLVDLSWLGGRIQREYTALIDPVGYNTASTSASVTPLAASVLPATTSNARAPAEVASPPRVSSAITPPKASARQTSRSKPAVAAAASAPEAEQTSETYAVKAGDTLSSIAGRVKPDGISLEQVLVGLYKNNQDAFDGNMNRLKRGKILRIPASSDLETTSKPEAIKEIKAQSANWQKYRRQLAESTAKSPAAETTEQAAGGRITAKVEDQGAKAPDKSKDVLKLSRGASKTDSAANRVRALEEEAASRKKALDEANQRVAELQKNVKKMEEVAALKSKSGAELQQKAEQVKASAATSVPATPVKPVASPVVAAPASKVEAASKPAEVASVVAEAASAVAAPASTAETQVKPKRVAPPPPPPPAPEPGIMDMLADNALLIGGGLAAVLLGAGGLIWSRNRRRPSVFENSLITSGDLKPNTVLGRTGGGVISTQAENSFLTDFSRQGLGTIDTDEVDPIAEADVYMAYGRNAQAEEILKDALVKDPHRQEIRLKLLDIFAARKDKTAFEEVAADLFAATGGNGQQWEQAAYLGRSIDPENPLYSGKGESSAAPVAAGVAAAAVTATVAAAAAKTFLSEPAKEEQELQELAAGLDEESALDFEFEMPAAEPQPASQLDNLSPKTEEVHLDFGTSIDNPSFDLDLPSAELTATEDTPIETEEDSLMALDLPIDLGKDFSVAEPDAEPETLDALLTPPVLAEPTFASSPDLSLPDLDLNLDMGIAEELAEAQALADFNAQLSATEESPLDMPELMAEPVLSEEENIDLKFDFNEAALGSEVAEIESPIDLDLEMAGGSVEEMDFTADDPVQTKIDLARAYIDMGDVEGAREILQEAEQEGNPQQQELARTLLTNL